MLHKKLLNLKQNSLQKQKLLFVEQIFHKSHFLSTSRPHALNCTNKCNCKQEKNNKKDKKGSRKLNSVKHSY